MALLDPTKILPTRFLEAKVFSLYMPADPNGHPYLVATVEGKPMAVGLAGDEKFYFWPIEKGPDENGFIVPDIKIGVDTGGASEQSHMSTTGSIVRKGDKLGILARPGGGMSQKIFIQLCDELPVGSQEVKIAFSKWEISLGEGTDKQVLFKFDLGKPA